MEICCVVKIYNKPKRFGIYYKFINQGKDATSNKKEDPGLMPGCIHVFQALTNGILTL